jgi:outer membrane protein assembly factor BamB
VINSEGNQSEFWSGLSHCANNLLVDNVLYITYGTHVKAVDIFTSTELWDIYISGAVDADGIAMADDGFLYVVTHNNKVYKINVDDQTSELFVYGSIGTYDQDMVYDAEYNRLLICSYQTNCPIFAVSLPDGEMSIACETGLDNLDGLAVDGQGNIYVASWGSNSVYKYNNEFTGDPEIASDGHNGPSGIEINNVDNILYVSNFYTDEVQEIPIPTVVTEGTLIESPIKLYQNFPNPFNPSTTITFNISSEKNEQCELVIYNLKGQVIRQYSLINSQTSIVWDGTDQTDKPVSSGLYIAKLKNDGEVVAAKKMMLIK